MIIFCVIQAIDGNCRLVSQDPPKPEDDPCADVAEAIGQKILQSGTTLAGIFRSWDQDMGSMGINWRVWRPF